MRILFLFLILSINAQAQDVNTFSPCYVKVVDDFTDNEYFYDIDSTVISVSESYLVVFFGKDQTTIKKWEFKACHFYCNGLQVRAYADKDTNDHYFAYFHYGTLYKLEWASESTKMTINFITEIKVI